MPFPVVRITLDTLLKVPVRTPEELFRRIQSNNGKSYRGGNNKKLFIRNGSCWDFGGKSPAPTRRIWKRLTGKSMKKKKIYVCHTCDNEKCGRPKHLWLGTQKENLLDMILKGRSATGDRHNSRTHPEKLQRGDKHWSRRHPEWIARGDRNGSRTQPDKFPSGDKHWTRLDPERVTKGNKHWTRIHPERILRGDKHWMKIHPNRIARGERHGSRTHPEAFQGPRRAR